MARKSKENVKRTAPLIRWSSRLVLVTELAEVAEPAEAIIPLGKLKQKIANKGQDNGGNNDAQHPFDDG